MAGLRAWASRATDRIPEVLVSVASYRLDLRRRERAISLGYDSPLVTWSDDWLTYSFARSGSYELTQKHFIATALLPMLDSRSTAIDVGANVGTYALFLGKYFDEVLAFDASPQMCKLLRLTLELTDVRNIRVSDTALGAEAGERLLMSPGQEIPNRGMGRVVTPSASPPSEETIPVKMARGDDVVGERASVAFVKVDVEGLETEVLRGFSETIRRERPLLGVETLSQNAVTQVISVLPQDYAGYGLKRGRRMRTLVPVSAIETFPELDLTYFIPRAIGESLVGTRVPELG